MVVEPMSRVKQIRQEKGLSRRELAERADITRGYLARIEQGYHKAPIRTLARIAKALGVPIGNIV